MEERTSVKTKFNFPEVGIVVEAETVEEATKIVQKQLKKEAKEGQGQEEEKE